jgi:hypothetical protein
VTPDLPTIISRVRAALRGANVGPDRSALFDGNFGPLMPLTFAIVGGTRAYEGLVDGLFTLGQAAVSARSRSCFDNASLHRSFGVGPP